MLPPPLTTRPRRITTHHASAYDDPASRLAAVVELIARLQTANSANAAARQLALDVAEYLGATRVIVGLCERPNTAVEVAAFSDLDSFSNRSDEARLAQAALQEAIARQEFCCWPPRDGDTSHGLLALRQFSRQNDHASVLASPLRDSAGQTRGAWLIVGATSTADAAKFMALTETPLATALQLLGQAKQSAFARLRNDFANVLKGWRGTLLAGGTMVAAALATIPLPQTIRCDCVLEPVSKRHVAAPFAGPLEKSFVEPGDVVQAGQLLARMDGREVRWELAGIRAELQRAAKEKAGHMAQHESGKQEMARYEVERLRARADLLEHRDANLQIRSPIDGIVVGGDLKKSEGRPLTIGQPLFEIAPLDTMTVEIAIAEDDVHYVRPGMPISFRLEGSPFQSRQATIERVHPRAEIRDQQNVFIAEARLENSLDELRPGMRGDAQITADRSPLGWQFIRKPLAATLAWLGW